MILKFPDLDTLKFVLLSGAVPPSVSLAPANAGFDEQGQLWLEPSAAPKPKTQDELKKYGVLSGKKSGAELSAEISCWLEMLPLVRDPGSDSPPEQTPVLFGLSSGEQLARLSLEILRLGNDRQSYRWLEEDGGSSRALLRVMGPPYYSLLRALDAQGPDAPVAFAERTPRVWVQLGFQHPLEGSIKPPPGQILLLRPPCMWTSLTEQPFREIYEILEFELPGKPLGYQEGKLEERLKVPLRLARGGGNEDAELWVLRGNPIAEVNNLVQNSDDQLLGRLAFAVGDIMGRQTIVLRVRPSRLPPPVLVLDAVGFRPFLKLPNLFLPTGLRLHPPLRRDIVRQQLADDPNVLTWLYPEGKDGRFTPETISQDAFRPLTEWVDYIIDREREALTAWVQSNTFDFEPFICDEEGPPRPKKAPPPERGSPDGKGRGSGQTIEVATPGNPEKGEKEYKPSVLDVISLVPEKPSAQKLRLDELETRFAGFEGPLDVPERQALWPEMAALNIALKNHDDAGLCWLNALWNSDDWPESWVWAWFQNECSAVSLDEEKGRSKPVCWAASVLQSGRKPPELAGEELDRVLLMKEPSLADVRALAAYLVWASRRPAPPAGLAERLNSIGRFLEANDGRVAVRCSWLAWLAFARLTHGDVLALARTRDRLLERLFRDGLRPDQDLPLFLRHTGRPARQQFRSIRPWMLEMCSLASNWSREANQAVETEGAGPTIAYIHLYFAFGLARLGEQEASRNLAEQARKLLEKTEEVHQVLFGAFAYRIKSAQESAKITGPLPHELMDELAKIESLQRYAVNRLRQHSHILEPDQRIDPYADWAARTDELSMKLAETAKLTDKQEIAQRLLRMLRAVAKGNQGAEQRAQILRTALDVSPRISEEFALEILGQLTPAWDSWPDAGEAVVVVGRAELLQRGLFVAAHFDKKDHVRALVARFSKLLQSQHGNTTFMSAVEKLAGESLRGLRKLGMRDEIDMLLKQMADAILGGQEPAAYSPDKQGPASLRALLHVASGWLFFGRERQAEPIINAARAVLFADNWHINQVPERTHLAGVYARTVGGAPVEFVKSRLTELFKELHNIRDTMTTSKYYSLRQLDLVEQVVLAVAGEDQVIGADARRWVDDDEYIIRRRIHRDFHLEKSRKDKGI